MVENYFKLIAHQDNKGEITPLVKELSVENGIKILITRKKKDYKKAAITICAAEEFLGSRKNLV